MNNNEFPHVSVLLDEVVNLFENKVIHTFIDGTLGAGGHAAQLLKEHPEIETYIGMDQDLEAHKIAKARLSDFSQKMTYVHSNFEHIHEYADNADGILVDLGMSSMQLDTPNRGFSFRFDAPLDMRMDQTTELKASDIVNTWTEEELGQLIKEYGEEKRWWHCAKQIVKTREIAPIETTFDLLKCLAPIWPRKREKKIEPASLVFQALRIAVNRELDVLDEFLQRAISLLAPGGRLVIISFHSLEDRAVKKAFAKASSDKLSTSGRGGLFIDVEPVVKLVTRKAIKATEEEISRNSRSRSARLRAVEKL